MYGSSAVIWMCKQQKCTVNSTTEGEYVATSKSFKVLKGLENLLNELGFNHGEASVIYNDNRSCVQLCKPWHLDELKHVDVAYCAIKTDLNEKRLRIKDCASTKMLADIFIKAVATGDKTACTYAG